MQINLPAVINDRPTRKRVASLGEIKSLGVATKIARNIHMRCTLAEAQNWRCCWCGKRCRPEPDHKDSATIEHVQPRSLGGADHWDNYAMACAQCNHRRGTTSAEDFMAGRISEQRTSESKKARRLEKKINRYIKKAHERNLTGWVRTDGTELCKMEWFNSLKIAQENHQQQVLDVLFCVDTDMPS